MPIFSMPEESAYGQNVKPFDGALLYFFDAGTTTPKTSYSDASEDTANAHPVVADANGRFSPIYLSGTFKARLTDKNGVQIWEHDNLTLQGDEFSFLGTFSSSTNSSNYPASGSLGDTYKVSSSFALASDSGSRFLNAGDFIVSNKNGALALDADWDILRGKTIDVPINEQLTLSRPSTTTVDIDAAQLTLFDSNSLAVLVGTKGVASSINLTLDQDNDTAGGGSNGVLGLDTGSFANSTWYHLYAITNGTTVSCVASLAPNWISTTNDGTAGATKGVDKTNISGYLWGKYVGAVYQNSSGTFDNFSQVGNRVSVSDQVVISGGTSSSSYASIPLGAFVPTTAKLFKGMAYLTGSSSGMQLNMASTSTPLGRSLNSTSNGGNVYFSVDVAIVESQAIYYKVGSSASDSLNELRIAEYDYEGIV